MSIALLTAVVLVGVIILAVKISQSPNRAAAGGGAVVFGALATGALSFVFAVLLVVNGDVGQAGQYLVASAISFGLLANAFFRS